MGKKYFPVGKATEWRWYGEYTVGGLPSLG